MNNAIWLLTALPTWYSEGAAHPFSGGALTLVPAIGLLSLLIGIIMGAIARRRGLLWFLLPFAFSECLVCVAGVMRGRVPYSQSAPLEIALYIFLAAQVAVCGYLIYRLKGARISATALAIFSVTYAVAGMFVAGMSFTDNWL